MGKTRQEWLDELNGKKSGDDSKGKHDEGRADQPQNSGGFLNLVTPDRPVNADDKPTPDDNKQVYIFMGIAGVLLVVALLWTFLL